MTDWWDRFISGLVVLFVLGVLGLVGWGIYELVTNPDTGYVIGKHYREARTTCGGKPFMCRHHDESWCLTLRDDDGYEGDQCMDKDTWDRYPVGSHYPDAR